MGREVVIFNETIEHRGLRFAVRHVHDDSAGEPWKESDGHGAVSEWTRRAKGPGERVLAQDRDSYRYYDFAGAVKLAKKDGWGTKGDEGLKPAEKAARAAEADFEFLRGWCTDEWTYLGVVVALEDAPEHTQSLWAIESNSGEYLDEVARELADQVIDELPEALRADEAKIARLREKLSTVQS